MEYSYLKRDILRELGKDYDASNTAGKIDEIRNASFKNLPSFYRQLIFAADNERSVMDVDPVIEFVETDEQHDVWRFFRIHTSSVATRKGPGRLVRLFVKDQASGKYLGIAALASDVAAYEARDAYVGWSTERRLEKLVHVMNITCCVALQPFGYNFNGGKLLVDACFSREVQDHVTKKYGHALAMITTFSINGKSVQYDRTPHLKFCGVTKGQIPMHVSDNLLARGAELMDTVGMSQPTRAGRIHKIQAIMNFLGISKKDIIKDGGLCMPSGQPRGVYIGCTTATIDECTRFLRGELDSFTPVSKPFAELAARWKARWAMQRSAHLVAQARFRVGGPELYNAKTEYEVAKTQRSNMARMEAMGEDAYRRDKAMYMQSYRDAKSRSSEPYNVDFTRVGQIIASSTPPVDIAVVAAFFDGDGSLHSGGNTYPAIEIGQCDPDMLINIAAFYGGSIHKRTASETGQKRTVYVLRTTGRFTRRLLEDLCDHAILKAEPIRAALELLDAIDHVDAAKAVAARTKLVTPWSAQIKPANYARLSWAYAAGFFDAEGCISTRVKKCGSIDVSLTITQVSDHGILHALASFVGYGTVSAPGRWVVHKLADIRDFLEKTVSLLTVKRRQAEDALELLNTEATKENYARRAELARAICADKHVSHELRDDDLARLNELFAQKKSELHPVLQTEEKAARKKAIYEKKSRRMQGEGNPNFGHERDLEHCVNLTLGVRAAQLAKRKITDETIETVRSLRAQGEKIVSIMARLGLSKSCVDDICSGKTLTRAEALDPDEVRRFCEANMKVRAGEPEPEPFKSRCNADLVLAVLRLRAADRDITAPAIVRALADRLSEVGGSGKPKISKPAKLTVAQVKNYLSGKTRLQPAHFPTRDGTTFAQYQELLDQV